MRGVKGVQPFRQRCRMFLIHNMPRMGEDLQFRARDVLGQEAGGFQVRAVLFPAEKQGGARNAGCPAAERRI